MPELVEVKQYVDFLNKYLKNNKIIEINILNGRYKTHSPYKNFDKINKNIEIKEVKQKGKFIYFLIKNSDYIFFNTLGLSGGWIYYDKKKDNYLHPKNIYDFFVEQNINIKKYMETLKKHLNIEFKLEDQNSIFFFDMLSFGTFKVALFDELENKLNLIGPDFFNINLNLFKQRLRLKKNLNKKIGIVLLDQKTLSGIGNYLRADCLWLAQISPHRLVKDINDIELALLYNSIINLIWSLYDDKSDNIEKGFKSPMFYNRIFFIYNNKFDIYGNKIKKEVLSISNKTEKNKRYIYWVEDYQK